MFKKFIVVCLISMTTYSALAQEKLNDSDAYRFFLYIKGKQDIEINQLQNIGNHRVAYKLY